MKKSLYYLCSFASAMVLFTACKKEDTKPSPDTENFNPLTTGSTWTYKHTETGTANYNFTLTVTNRDTTANGKTYKVLTSSLGPNTYLARVGTDNYRFASFPSIGVNSFEELFLKEDKAVDGTWSSSANVNLSGIPLLANLTYTVKEKGASRTVNGKSFNNVTRVRLDLSLFGAPVGGGDFYYQEGVGMIQDNISVSQPIAYTSGDEIVSYEIK
jgi:hypothetical protein